jgi:hypothetical protein
MFGKIQDKAFNPDHVSYFAYSRGDGPQPQPSLTIHFVGGAELSFGHDYAESVWERLIKGAEVVAQLQRFLNSKRTRLTNLTPITICS